MLFHQTVEDHRPVMVQHLHDRLIQIGGILAQDALGAERLGQLHEIRQRLGPAAGIALAMQKLLPLPHHAKAFVVEDELLDGQVVLHRGAHLLHVHQPRRLARDIDHQGVGMRHLHADRRRKAVAHGAEAAGGHPAVGILETHVLRSPHLMLAHLGADIAIMALGQRLKPRQRVLRPDHRAGLLELQALDAAPLLDLRPPFRDGLAVGLAAPGLPDLQQIAQHIADIANDRDVRLDHLVDRRGIDIDMRLGAAGAERVQPPGDPVVEPRADIDHQVAIMHRHVGLVKAVHPQHAQPVRPAGGIGAKPHQRRGHGNARRRDQLAQKAARLGTRIDHAAPGIEDRALGLLDGRDQIGDALDIALDLRLVVMRAGPRRRDIFGAGELHVLGDVHQHRPRAPRGGDVKRLMHGVGQVLGVRHQPVMLGAGAGDAHGVGFLKGVGADHERRHLTGQHHQRDAVHQRIGQAGDRIGRAGPRGDQHHTRPPGRARVALGGMHRALFVTHEDMADPLLLEDLVIDRQHRAAGISEHDVHTLILEGLNHHFCSGHLTCHVSLAP